jgi:CBS domain containing-hemolysin-like protein
MSFVIFATLLFFSGFFSSTETAFFTLRPEQVRLMQQKKRKNANIIARLRNDQERLLITILIGNNVVNLFMASFATVVAANAFDSAAIGIATGGTTFFILVFGEIVPKSVAITHAKKITNITARPIYLFYILLYPLSTILMKMNEYAAKVFGGNKKGFSVVTKEEVRAMTRIGVESGHINYREREMIEKIFRFNDIPVGDVVTPLYRVEMLNGMTPIEQIAHLASKIGHSRYPVYDNNDRGNIIGYVHINTIMQLLNSERRGLLLREFISKIPIIDAHMKIERVFRAMVRDKVHLYLVHRHNKKRDIQGIVTLEDIIEEIMGEIEDETDQIGIRK